MRIFVTGASGHIGGAVTDELIAGGHAVVGLARSDSSASALAARGAEVVRGDLGDGDLLRRTAADSDGVIHLAFRHDLMYSGDYQGAVDADSAAIDALTQGLVGSGKSFVGTAGTLALAFGAGRVGDGIASGELGRESDVLPGGPRIDAENMVIGRLIRVSARR